MLKPLDGEVGSLVRPDGTRLRTIQSGAGDDVLLLHGFGMSADAWSLVQPKLVAQGRRVIAYDHRAHGASTIGGDGVGSAQMRGDLLAIAEEFDINDATMVCHSMSNFIALGLLADARFRKRFRRVVLVNPVTGHAGKGSPSAAVQMPMMRWGIAQRMARNKILGKVLVAPTVGPAATPEIIEATRISVMEIPKAAAACLPMMKHESVETVLPEVDVPIHVLTSADDRTTPSWHAELIAARAPNVRVDYISGAGHMLNWEAPGEIIRAVMN